MLLGTLSHTVLFSIWAACASLLTASSMMSGWPRSEVATLMQSVLKLIRSCFSYHLCLLCHPRLLCPSVDALMIGWARLWAEVAIVCLYLSFYIDEMSCCVEYWLPIEARSDFSSIRLRNNDGPGKRMSMRSRERDNTDWQTRQRGMQASLLRGW